MTDEEIARLIEKEFSLKLLGITEQYLEIHEPVYENGSIKIDRIDREKEPEEIIVYLPVKDEYFYFSVYIDPGKKKILSVNTESRNLVSFIVTSETMSANEMLSLTKLEATNAWNKGDFRKNGNTIHTISGLEFEPNPEPDEFEDKLKKLLLFLHKDREGVHKLVSQASGYIKVIMDFHAGNQLLGGLSIDLDCIKMMSGLNLQISVDITAWGNPFK